MIETLTIEPTGEIHEAANVFPMLPEDELQELAADIKANGLIHPIVLDEDGALIDGRNRLAACRMAGVEPTFTSINGADPVAYILSANVARRNLTKGQRAMAGAMIRKQSLQTHRELGDAIGVSKNDNNRTAMARSIAVASGYIGMADVVLDHASDLADAVMAGTMPLNEAYAKARQLKEATESREEQALRAERDLGL